MTSVNAASYIAIGSIYSPSAITNALSNYDALSYQIFSTPKAMPAHMYKAVTPYLGYSEASYGLYTGVVPLNLMPNKAMFCGSLYSQATITTLHVAPAYSSSLLYSHNSSGYDYEGATLADHFPESIIMWKGKAQVNMYVYDEGFTGYSGNVNSAAYSVSFSALPSTALGYNIVTMVLAPYSFSGMTNGSSGRYYIKSVSRY